MYQLRYLAQARDDLLQIKRYIARETGSNAIALRYTEKLRQQCRELAFRYRGALVEIVSIIEGHRDIEGLFHS